MSIEIKAAYDSINSTLTQMDLDDLLKKGYQIYNTSGSIPTEIIEAIIGKQPVIPDTPDSDTRSDAYDEMVLYSKARINVVNKIKTYNKN